MLATAGGPLRAQLAPPATGGVVALDHLLQRLGESRRVLVVGAHPDDEDTATLTYAVQALGAEAAYLSLTRGDGGQNIIGSELGIPLGLVRSQELQAARAIDGARQFFTRAYDFGYTRSLEETQQFWPPDSILKDVTRVVRRFRPHVIVSVFSGTARDGHGQHQMAGVMARAVFDAAGDPARFPELSGEEGLEPWTPLKLYRSTRFDSAMTTVTVPTGRLDPRTGKTYFQIAMASRSQHRSQDFGVLQPTGPRTGRLGLIESRVAGPDTGMFAGIAPDTSWAARVADSLRLALAVARPDAVAPALIRALEAAADGHGDGDAPHDRVRALLGEALAVSRGIVVDAVTGGEAVTPGTQFDVAVTVYNGGPSAVRLERLSLDVPPGFAMSDGPAALAIPAGDAYSGTLTVSVPAEARLTEPYFLRRPLVGAMYDWSGVAPELRGEPFDPPLVALVAVVGIDGRPVSLRREATYRFADQVSGEVRRPLRVVPTVDVRLEPDRVVWSSASTGAREFTVALRHHGADTVAGDVRLVVDGWSPPAPQPFHLTRRGETTQLTFRLERPRDLRRGAVSVRAVARAADGRTFDRSVELVDYPHIRPTPYVREAVSEIRIAPIALPDARAIGYVRGASDRVPEALQSLGLPVTLLDAETLARGDLSRFDVIVVGSRAYETDSALVRHNDRVLDYVRRGGRLVVQYQQYQFVRGGFAPYPLDIARPHDRVTDETAPVTPLRPDHPAFTRPNRLGPEDWDGWPQERGLYFAGTWDARYTPLLEMADPGREPVRGGLLVARYGEGTYVYTGVSFFRALPAGVPGAVRLFLNLLALGG